MDCAGTVRIGISTRPHTFGHPKLSLSNWFLLEAGVVLQAVDPDVVVKAAWWVHLGEDVLGAVLGVREPLKSGLRWPLSGLSWCCPRVGKQVLMIKCSIIKSLENDQMLAKQ